jgi:hypothetical protein
VKAYEFARVVRGKVGEGKWERGNRRRSNGYEKREGEHEEGKRRCGGSVKVCKDIQAKQLEAHSMCVG